MFCKRHIITVSLLLTALFATAQTEVLLADPYILLDGDVYYAYGTHSPNGIVVYTSANLVDWQEADMALHRDSTTETRWFWAPEVYRRGDTYYMFYSANEHLYLATADSPAGPFRQQGGRLMQTLIDDEKCIDSSVFFDDDDRAYLYFVRFTDGNYIWMCDLDSELHPVAGTLRPCFGVTDAWEMKQARVAEGPFVVKHDGTYYLTYSANHFESQDYAVGYATSRTPHGPWKKSEKNPILHRHHGRYGTGHHSLFTDKQGQLRIVYHAHRSATSIHPRMMHIARAGFQNGQLVVEQGRHYSNPVIGEDAPDPSVIKGDDGYYYLFSTGEKVFRSNDLINWNYVSQAFGDNSRPTFVPGVGGYWAPCVTRQDGRYVLYFALSTWGGQESASIGVATSDTPAGPYRLVGDGKLFTSGEVGVQNSIDPNYIEVDGHKYIVWGSWHGIWLIELTADGLAVKDINVKCQIAGTRFEAPYIYHHDGYYYLFCSIGACCEGERSTYETVVGRSTNLFGPYLNKEGKPMMENACTLLLTSNEQCIAPGHNSHIIEDEQGRTWITYHGYLRSAPEKGRVVWLGEVKWHYGWPHISTDNIK